MGIHPVKQYRPTKHPQIPLTPNSPTLDFGPGFDYSGPDSMCGKNATTPLFPVKTLKVEAGSTIGFGAMGQAGGPEYENKRPVSAL